jgi:two-component system OmpR family sensor kinase
MIGTRYWLVRQRTAAGRLTFEALLVVAGGLAVGLLACAVSARLTIEREQLMDVLALLATGVGATAVGLGQTAGRLSGNRRAAWLVPALALYCAVVVPGPMLMSDEAEATAFPRPGTLVATVAMIVLLLAAIRPPARSRPRLGWMWAGVWACVTLFLDLTAAAAPLSVPGMAVPLTVNVAVLAGWASISTAVVVAGYRVGSPPLWRLGLGFGVIAAAHLYRVVRPDPMIEPTFVFGVLRVLGVVVVLFGMAQLLRRALTQLIAERFAHQEDLRVASLQAEELVRVAVERDHELRNGLSGISGMTRLLGDTEADERRRRANRAVVNELERLRGLLESADDPTGAVGVYEPGQVVREIVALWRVAGLQIQGSLDPDLMVLGRPTTLAQVLTNLLTNCSRHAPGSPVRVVAFRKDQVVCVQVRDDGCSNPVSVQDVAGHGVGLHISRRLLTAEGARLLTEQAPGSTGFTATVELPAMPAPRGATALVLAEPKPSAAAS